eukprot:360947-Chlamydomonas_euryale.AAC.1
MRTRPQPGTLSESSLCTLLRLSAPQLSAVRYLNLHDCALQRIEGLSGLRGLQVRKCGLGTARQGLGGERRWQGWALWNLPRWRGPRSAIADPPLRLVEQVAMLVGRGEGWGHKQGRSRTKQVGLLASAPPLSLVPPTHFRPKNPHRRPPATQSN